MLSAFLSSRRPGLSQHTLLFYQRCLEKAIGIELTGKGINEFLSSLNCDNGKHGYYRAIRALCNWLVKNDYLIDNPLHKIDPPILTKRMLPSLTTEQVNYLIGEVSNPRDKAIISLFADSGMRLNELAHIRASDIDWETQTITIWGKGNKQRRAPFTTQTAKLLRTHISQDGTGENIWSMKRRGIQNMLLELAKKTGLPCNPHTFRRSFACNLHRKGLSTLDIMHLGGWSDLSMVLRYTRSITFDDCLQHYRKALRE